MAKPGRLVYLSSSMHLTGSTPRGRPGLGAHAYGRPRRLGRPGRRPPDTGVARHPRRRVPAHRRLLVPPADPVPAPRRAGRGVPGTATASSPPCSAVATSSNTTTNSSTSVRRGTPVPPPNSPYATGPNRADTSTSSSAPTSSPRRPPTRAPAAVSPTDLRRALSRSPARAPPRPATARPPPARRERCSRRTTPDGCAGRCSWRRDLRAWCGRHWSGYGGRGAPG